MQYTYIRLVEVPPEQRDEGFGPVIAQTKTLHTGISIDVAG